MNWSYFLNRLREPSTMAGLAALGMLFGVDPEKVQTVAGAATAVVAAAAVFLPDPAKPKE